MNATPVTNPATVIETLQPAGTDDLSKKKNTVAAIQAIETIQNEIPTKSSEAKRTVSAFAAPAKPNKATVARANNLSFFILKTPSFIYLV